MPHNRLPRIVKNDTPKGKKNQGRPLKRLLDVWDQNGSTSSPTPRQLDDHGDDGDDDDYYNDEERFSNDVICRIIWRQVFLERPPNFSFQNIDVTT
jgi:hypothetical protein